MYSLLILQLFKFKKKSIIFIFTIIGIFLIYHATFRESGIDYESYIRNYEEVQTIGFELFKRRMEPLFKLILYISPHFRVAFFLVAFIAVYFKLKGIIEYSLYPFISLVFYYYTYYNFDDMGRIRIGLASAIMIISIKYLDDRKFLFYMIIAFFIHKSAITYIILYFFYKLNLDRKKYALFLLLAILLSIIDISLLKGILNKIPYLNSTVIEYMNELKKIGFSLYMIPKLFFMSLFILRFETLSKYSYFKKLFAIYFLGNFIYFTFNSIEGFASRGSETLLCVEFLVLPYLLKSYKDKTIKVILFISLIAYYSYIGREYLVG